MKNLDFSSLQRFFSLINEAITSDVYNLGSDFFNSIVLKLNETLEADYTFVGRVTPSGKSIETISLVNKNGLIDNFEYDLEDTPCENVVGQKRPCSYPKNVAALFPKDELLVQMGIEAYVGIPLYNSKKEPIGIMVCLFESELTELDVKESILMIFASKAGSELEHMQLYEELNKHKEGLELMVDERTSELNEKNIALEATNDQLESTLSNLKETQTQLIQAKKMASLGVLTSGVAHEINNPLNYLVGAHTGLTAFFNDNQEMVNENTSFLVESIKDSVDRISKIVKGLNQFSRETPSMTEICDINLIIDNCLTILNNQTRNRIELIKEIQTTNCKLIGNSGKLHQVFLNLLKNAVESIKEDGKIKITTSNTNGMLNIKIIDSGCGISKENISKIMDPFFTTKGPNEGTGLGLAICYSIISDHKGTLEFKSEPQIGTTAIINLPLNNN